MRILLIPFQYFEDPIGGVDICLRHITASLKNKGHKITIIAISVERKESFQIIDGIEIYRLPFWNYVHFLTRGYPILKMLYLKEILQFPYALFKMWVIFIKKKPEVVNMHYAGPASVALLLLSYVMNFKFILTLHGFGTQHLRNHRTFKWSKFLYKKLLKRADFLTAPSYNLIEDAIRWEPSVKQKCKVIANGVDINEFTTDYKVRNYIDGAGEMRQSQRYIYSDYTYWPNKDYGLLLFVYRSILDLGYDVDLVLSIIESERRKYDKIPAIFGLGQRVRIVYRESTTDREILLKDADCYISLSQSSFCDFVALEAISLGRPIIADRRNDIRKIKNENNRVVFVDTNEESEMVSAVERLLKQEKISPQRVKLSVQEVLFERNLLISPYILTVANLERYKGISTLIKAFKKAYIEYPGLNLVIAGGGDHRRILERFSESIGLKNKVIFLGAATRQEVVRLFRGCEFFVLPSWIEPFGIVNLEAMAAGKAIVASCVDGIPEIVKNEVNGILVEPKNTNALAEAMMRLLSDKELRERLGKNGREMVQGKKFCWDRIADEYMKVYGV